MELTVRAIDTAKPKSKQYKLTDGRGLCLLVMPSGAKYWRWRYRFKGTEKMMSLGEYPEVGLKEARERHSEARKLWSGGIDPLAERKAEAEAKQNEERERQRQTENSFESVARAWWKWWLVGKSPRHAETVMLRLEADVFPAYGHKNMEKIISMDIRDVMLAVERRGSRDVAKRIYETTGQIFRYAVAHGKATRNPAADFKPRDILLQANSENFARVDVKDLPELLAKMDDYWGDAITRFALKLVSYTFVRTSELIEAPWTEFDLDNALWVIPPERMKMGTAHIVPLSRQAVEVLRALRLLTGNGRLLFPGAMDKRKPMSNNTILGALYRLGYKYRMTGHGFRGLASTILNEHDFDEAHVEMQLAHLKRNKVAAAYNHAKYLKQRIIMMQWWADYLEAQLALGRRSLAA